MNNINKYVKKYIKDIRKLGPSCKDFRQFLRKYGEMVCLSSDSDQIHASEELYASYGAPSDVISDYYKNCDADTLSASMRLAKIKKTILQIICAVIISAMLIRAAYLILVYKRIYDSSVFFEETTLQINGIQVPLPEGGHDE